MKYCKLVKTSINNVMHNPKHRGKCPFSFKCKFKKKGQTKCEYMVNL